MGLGGWSYLASMAGIINAVGFLSFQHQGVTHLTGITTQLGALIAQRQVIQAFHLLTVIFSFILGSVFSGFLIQNTTLKLGRRYGVALIVESVLLLIAIYYLTHNKLLGTYLASCACGLQNAMASTYSGAVLRTTHVSGLFTDIGILTGQWLRGLKIDKKRFFLNFILIISFLIGSILGTVGFNFYSYSTLYIPAFLIGFSGLAYTASYHCFHLKKNK